jgi:hypothetical protein
MPICAPAAGPLSPVWPQQTPLPATVEIVPEALAAIGRTPIPGADMKRCASLCAILAALVVADSLYTDRAKFKIVLLDNDTQVPFVTGDQPIINYHATFGYGDVPEKLEYFYPLSPKRAMVLLESARERSSVLSANEVQQFNKMMVVNSHGQVFGNSGRYLDELKMNGEDF